MRILIQAHEMRYHSIDHSIGHSIDHSIDRSARSLSRWFPESVSSDSNVPQSIILPLKVSTLHREIVNIYSTTQGNTEMPGLTWLQHRSIVKRWTTRRNYCELCFHGPESTTNITSKEKVGALRLWVSFQSVCSTSQLLQAIWFQGERSLRCLLHVLPNCVLQYKWNKSKLRLPRYRSMNRKWHNYEDDYERDRFERSLWRWTTPKNLLQIEFQGTGEYDRYYFKVESQ